MNKPNRVVSAKSIVEKMKIIITDRRKIFAIQNEFSKVFPFLKLEFFAKPARLNGASPNKVLRESSKTLGECRTVHISGMLTITPDMTVKELEQHFRDIYGLTIQILRKSGKAWLGTKMTDGWSLKEQNEQGESLSGHIPVEVEVKKTKKSRASSAALAKKYFIN
jgi:hypothetical protein